MFNYDVLCTLVEYSTAIFLLVSFTIFLCEYICYTIFEYDSFSSIVKNVYQILANTGFILVVLNVLAIILISVGV